MGQAMDRALRSLAWQGAGFFGLFAAVGSPIVGGAVVLAAAGVIRQFGTAADIPGVLLPAYALGKGLLWALKQLGPV